MKIDAGTGSCALRYGDIIHIYCGGIGKPSPPYSWTTGLVSQWERGGTNFNLGTAYVFPMVGTDEEFWGHVPILRA